MNATTPFFPLLSRQLFGRPPRSVRQQLQQQAQRLQRLSLGKLTGLFAHYIPSSLLEPTAKGTGSRQRLFSRRTTFWAFLAQVLSPQSSCRETLRKLQAWQAASDSPLGVMKVPLCGQHDASQQQESGLVLNAAKIRLRLRRASPSNDGIPAKLQREPPFFPS